MNSLYYTHDDIARKRNEIMLEFRNTYHYIDCFKSFCVFVHDRCNTILSLTSSQRSILLSAFWGVISSLPDMIVPAGSIQFTAFLELPIQVGIEAVLAIAIFVRSAHSVFVGAILGCSFSRNDSRHDFCCFGFLACRSSFSSALG